MLSSERDLRDNVDHEKMFTLHRDGRRPAWCAADRAFGTGDRRVDFAIGVQQRRWKLQHLGRWIEKCLYFGLNFRRPERH